VSFVVGWRYTAWARGFAVCGRETAVTFPCVSAAVCCRSPAWAATLRKATVSLACVSLVLHEPVKFTRTEGAIRGDIIKRAVLKQLESALRNGKYRKAGPNALRQLMSGIEGFDATGVQLPKPKRAVKATCPCGAHRHQAHTRKGNCRLAPQPKGARKRKTTGSSSQNGRLTCPCGVTTTNHQAHTRKGNCRLAGVQTPKRRRKAVPCPCGVTAHSHKAHTRKGSCLLNPRR
jgi:hypothetical protein